MNALAGLGHYRLTQAVTGRFREAGDLTLDFTHHDGRVEDRWLGLELREFAILWRLAERPGEPVCETELTADLSRVRFGCDGGDIAAHVARLAAKLAGFGLEGLVSASSGGRYVLAAVPPADTRGPSPFRGH